MPPTSTSTTEPLQLKLEEEKSQVPAAKSSVLNTDLSGGKPLRRLHEVPTFTDKYAERKWAKEQMAGAFRVFAKLGYANGASGHISLRDPVLSNCFWINPYAVHFGMIKVSDLILVNEDGEPMEPTKHKVNTAGFIIHSSIHKARPDINAACHTHTPYGKAWSAFGRGLEMLDQDACMFYNDLNVYESFGGVVLAKAEGTRIAEALGPNKKNLILQNHGLLTCGETIGEAAGFFIALERCCQSQLLAEAAAANGIAKKYIDDEDAEYTKKGTGTPAVMYMQFLPEYRLVEKETGGEFME